MATVTNKAQNTATPTNKDYSTKSKTFAETAPKTFAEMPNSFNNPQDFANKSASSESTVTNKSADS